MHHTVYLSDPVSSLRIEYSCAAMEDIRECARNGLMAVPRVPMGVGGLLIGARDNDVIRILTSLEIPCSHSAGPSFILTADEKKQCREMMKEAGAADGSGRATVVGWYCSKARGDGSLSDEDLNFHREFFPEPWQIVMVARPTALDPMHVSFSRRDAADRVVKELGSVVNAWRPPAEEVGAVPEMVAPEMAGPEMDTPEPQEHPKPEPVKIEPPAPAPAALSGPAESKLSDLAETLNTEKRAAAPARPSAPPGLFGVPGLQPPRPHKRRSSLTMILGIVAIAAVLGAAAVLTQDEWMPRPALSLSSSEVNGSLLIRWNAEALRGMEHASMYINDGGELQSIPLDRFQLDSGLFNYTPKKNRVTAKLDAGSITAITAWFAAPPPTAPAAGTSAPAAGTEQEPAAAAPAPAVKTHPAIDGAGTTK
jgi:hypothetical protein